MSGLSQIAPETWSGAQFCCRTCLKAPTAKLRRKIFGRAAGEIG
jgi:hypothetical protein